MCVWTKKRGSINAVVLMATPCPKSLHGNGEKWIARNILQGLDSRQPGGVKPKNFTESAVFYGLLQSCDSVVSPRDASLSCQPTRKFSRHRRRSSGPAFWAVVPSSAATTSSKPRWRNS